MASSKSTIGCIGKCTSGLTAKELDIITNSIDKTLSSPQGMKIFKKYLEQDQMGSDQSSLSCLELYQKCSEAIEIGELNSDTSLKERVSMVQEFIQFEINGVPELNGNLLKECEEALKKDTREALVTALKNIQTQIKNFLGGKRFGPFKKYASEPCPLMK